MMKRQSCASDEETVQDLWLIDPTLPGFLLPRCARCNDALPREDFLVEPGRFCASCIADMFARAESFGEPIGDLALRYNALVLSFLPPLPSENRARVLLGDVSWR